MLQLVEDRKQIKIFVTPGAKKIVEDFASQFDMTETGVASRIYRWFGGLPLPVQKWITGLTDASEGEGMQMFAAQLARALEEAKSAPQAGGRPYGRVVGVEETTEAPRPPADAPAQPAKRRLRRPG